MAPEHPGSVANTFNLMFVFCMIIYLVFLSSNRMDHNMEMVDLMILGSIRKKKLGKVKGVVQDLEKVVGKSKATFLSLQCRMKQLKEELAASNKEKE